MKTLAVVSLVAATFSVAAWSQAPQNDRCPSPPPPPADPVVDLFDTDGDGEISESEVQDAVASLQRLDQNQDGSVTRNEIPRPPHHEPRRHHGPGHTDRRPPRGRRPVSRDNGIVRMQRSPEAGNTTPGTLIFRGGYETDRQDNGRPVALIAAALGVSPEIFREAFSRVNPVRGGEPSEARVRANKEVLLQALSQYGISNHRLDAVSNYYRYRPGGGSLWRHTPAVAQAIIQDGKVTGFTLTEAGSGYLKAPSVTVVGYEDVTVKAEIGFSEEMARNGRITKLTVVE